jgi:hypothetical protein
MSKNIKGTKQDSTNRPEGGELRNKSCKPECVLSFNMGWLILVFYPEPEARDNIY